ncbi:uncharacterized protein N7506_005720 [Penicillium brevicompactum]|uniref:uncharacterized protein n=1 Tax=Penicillium brevicompactum TaxID=5074 RepID=UPI0025415294|nr:uncharacterized protein N7506_005720 [Penicillium brevicompactum]KAJ5335784.1 hypothetical protein N7506_005720 [Penicillium brevicompactum]
MPLPSNPGSSIIEFELGSSFANEISFMSGEPRFLPQAAIADSVNIDLSLVWKHMGPSCNVAGPRILGEESNPGNPGGLIRTADA